MRVGSTGRVAAVLGIAVVLLAGCASAASSSREPATRGADMLTLTTTTFQPQRTTELGAASGTASGSAQIPERFATTAVPGGRNVSIPFSWSDPPQRTRSFALALIDTAPVAHDWVHWLVGDIPATARGLGEGASLTAAMPAGAVEFANSYGRPGYGGPQPPPGTGAHPYVTTLYALDVEHLDLPRTATLAQFQSAISGHVLASASVIGRFGR